MFKRLLIIIFVLIAILVALQLFGGRDFTQVELAMDKYNNGGELSSLVNDITTIFKGGKVKESLYPNSRYEKMVMYRWVDELGEVHVSERKPKTGKYEEIKLGDLKFSIEEGMSEEQIKQVLKLPKKK